MHWLTLEDIKAQCRIEPTFTAEDGFLADCGEAAEALVLNYIGRTYEDVRENYGEVPADIRLASRLVVDSLYQYRGTSTPQTLSEVPFASARVMLAPYMRLTMNDNNTHNKGCNI